MGYRHQQRQNCGGGGWNGGYQLPYQPYRPYGGGYGYSPYSGGWGGGYGYDDPKAQRIDAWGRALGFVADALGRRDQPRQYYAGDGGGYQAAQNAPQYQPQASQPAATSSVPEGQYRCNNPNCPDLPRLGTHNHYIQSR